MMYMKVNKYILQRKIIDIFIERKVKGKKNVELCI